MDPRILADLMDENGGSIEDLKYLLREWYRVYRATRLQVYREVLHLVRDNTDPNDEAAMNDLHETSDYLHDDLVDNDNMASWHEHWISNMSGLGSYPHNSLAADGYAQKTELAAGLITMYNQYALGAADTAYWMPNHFNIDDEWLADKILQSCRHHGDRLRYLADWMDGVGQFVLGRINWPTTP